MQANSELTSKASLDSEICEDFSWKMKLDASDFDQTEKSPPSDEEIENDDDDEDDDDDDEEEFSFACIGADESPISADDAFHNGQIKPIFPLFDQSLLNAVDASDLPRHPPVKKVFVEAQDSAPPSTAEEGEEAAGPYCAWSRKAVEASPENCKKSNSTGFSKIWRFRELSNRSNSDGRDAFVFLNNGPTATNSKRDNKVEERDISSEKKPAAAAGEGKANNSGPASLGNGKVKKGKKKGETASLSAYEMHHVRNRALREGDRRRSYLPYRPELVGFFTNVNGGLSRNVHHPF